MEKEDTYTKDGTVDYHRNPANKTETGTWKACPYILGICTVLVTKLLNMIMKINMFISFGINQQELSVVKDWHTTE